MIPSGAIGARFSPDGVTLYLTDATGLGIYDVTNPASPQVHSHVPLPRIGGTGGMHLVDVSDPAAPAIRASRPTAPGLTVYDVRDLSRSPVAIRPRDEELAWVCGEDRAFAFDVTDPARPRLVLGGPGGPQPGHLGLVGALTRRARTRAWPDRAAAVGFYVSAGSFWGAYLALSDCPALGSSGGVTGRTAPSPIGEWDRLASWGREPVPSLP